MVVLLSSYRDFPTDDGWDWLHNDSPYASALVFEPVSDGSGKCEMVVTEKWRSKVSPLCHTMKAVQSVRSGDLAPGRR